MKSIKYVKSNKLVDAFWASRIGSLSSENIWLKILSYPKAILATLFIFIETFFFSLIAIAGSFLGGRERFANWVLYNWSALILRAFNIELQVFGQENLSDRGVVFVFNHTSFFDIPIFYTGIQKTARFGAKYELFKIPFFGRAMKVFDMLPIARHRREKVLDLYNQSIQKVKDGKSFILAGEGTRQKKPGVGDKFKAGPFIFAINGGIEVVPVVLKGSFEILPRTRFFPCLGKWRAKAEIHILPAVPSVGYSLETRKDLQDKVQKLMAEKFQEVEGL